MRRLPWTPVGPRNHVLDWVQISHWKGQFWGNMCRPVVQYRNRVCTRRLRTLCTVRLRFGVAAFRQIRLLRTLVVGGAEDVVSGGVWRSTSDDVLSTARPQPGPVQRRRDRWWWWWSRRRHAGDRGRRRRRRRSTPGDAVVERRRRLDQRQRRHRQRLATHPPVLGVVVNQSRSVYTVELHIVELKFHGSSFIVASS